MRELTKAQLYQLTVTRDVGGGWYPGPGGASACRALVRRGLMFKHGQYGPYSLTPAGRAALKDPTNAE
jgi:hypothetical protein